MHGRRSGLQPGVVSPAPAHDGQLDRELVVAVAAALVLPERHAPPLVAVGHPPLEVPVGAGCGGLGDHLLGRVALDLLRVLPPRPRVEDAHADALPMLLLVLAASDVAGAHAERVADAEHVEHELRVVPHEQHLVLVRDEPQPGEAESGGRPRPADDGVLAHQVLVVRRPAAAADGEAAVVQGEAAATAVAAGADLVPEERLLAEVGRAAALVAARLQRLRSGKRDT